MQTATDVAIVGAGIAGLAHACLAARQGLRVDLFERSGQASGASIRNFGMIWPIGQPADRLPLALRSREIWTGILHRLKLDPVSTGSLHLATSDDEAAVLTEFAELAPALGYRCHLTTRGQLRQCVPAARESVRAALWSGTEMVLDPVQVVPALSAYLQAQPGVALHFGTSVHAIQLPQIYTSRGTWHAGRAIVCGGDDLCTLYPEVLSAAGLIPCKLQMLRTAPQPAGWNLGAAIAGGLTLRFYPSFRICPSLPALRARIAEAMPEYDRFGIHVMASQNAHGAVTIGDSHEYGNQISVFDKAIIDRLILDYFYRLLNLPNPEIAERWQGFYLKDPGAGWFEAEPEPGVRIITGLGGAGMTLSFGLAEQTWRNW